LLYLLIVLVGIDLVELKLGSAAHPEVMVLPVLVIIGSLAGGMAAAALTGEGCGLHWRCPAVLAGSPCPASW
jgi:uncharacterized membrane protein YbjE (DUF340 family)